MMRYLLMDSAFPDIVAEWAEQADIRRPAGACANDNGDAPQDELSDPLLALVARAEIDATRLW